MKTTNCISILALLLVICAPLNAEQSEERLATIAKAVDYSVADFRQQIEVIKQGTPQESSDAIKVAKDDLNVPLLASALDGAPTDRIMEIYFALAGINGKKLREENLSAAIVGADLLIEELKNPKLVIDGSKSKEKGSYFDTKEFLMGRIAQLLNFGTKEKPRPDTIEGFITYAEAALLEQKNSLK